MLICNNLEKKYMSVTAINDISLQIEPGKIYALLGPNGSGKTTFMKIAAGLIKPSNGTITYKGGMIGPFSKGEISYMPTEPFFYSYMTVKDVGKYYHDFFPDFDLEHFNHMLTALELDPTMKARHLSSGLAAKLKLATTLSRKASIYMLDEPLNGIDLVARDQIINSILATANGVNTFIISSHLVDELEKIIDEAIFIKHGNIALKGNAEELRQEHNKSIVELYKTIYTSEGEVSC